ncbi:MAG: hypothetical protein MRY21_02810 [Simkaniaceae bacterium]|nr:hypothetical protein [Simkaniaceae bacterium]
MYKKWLLTLSILIFSKLSSYGVVCNFDGSRLGDRLHFYARSKWVAHKYQLPFHIIPPPGFLRFYRFNKTTPILDVDRRDLRRVRNEGEIDREGLFALHWQFICEGWGTYHEMSSWSSMMEDRAFRDGLREDFCYLREQELIKPPEGVTSVAVHIRIGEGMDRPPRSQKFFTLKAEHISSSQRIKRPPRYRDRVRGIDLLYPMKFAPPQFYVDQIKRLSEMLDHRPLYVFIFSDILSPQKLKGEIESRVNLPNITFDAHSDESKYRRIYHEDFQSLFNFDCLIRAGSHFSQMAHLAGRHKIVIYPTSYFWYDECLYMDDIVTEVNGEVL